VALIFGDLSRLARTLIFINGFVRWNEGPFDTHHEIHSSILRCLMEKPTTLFILTVGWILIGTPALPVHIIPGNVDVFTDDATYRTVDSGDGHSFTLWEEHLGEFGGNYGFPLTATLALQCPVGFAFQTYGNQASEINSPEVSVSGLTQLTGSLQTTIFVSASRTDVAGLQFDNIQLQWTSAVPGTYYITYDASSSSGFWNLTDGAVIATITLYDGGARFMTNGTGGGNFSSGSTWFGGAAPSSSDSVTVQSGDALTVTTGSVGDFVVEPGASVVHSSSSDLSIYGDYVLHGTHSGGSSSSDVRFKKADGVITGTGTLGVDGTIYFDEDQVIPADADITFDANMNMATGRTITNYGTVTLGTPHATLNSGGSWVQMSGAVLNVGYDLVWDLDATAVGNTVNYVRTNGQNFNPTTYYDLSTSGTGNKALMHGNVVVTNTLTIGNNTEINAMTNALTLHGDLVNNNTTPGEGYYQSISTDGTVVFAGTADQRIRHAGGLQEFEHLTVNKSSGNLILWSTDLDVKGTVALVSGDIVLGSNDLVVSGEDKISGGSASSYIQADGAGMLEVAYGSASGIGRSFPIGDNANYLPLFFRLSGATLAAGASMRFSVTSAAHPERGVSVSYLNRYYTFDATGFSGDIDYDIRYTYLEGDVVGIESELKAAKYDAAGWTGGTAGSPAPKPWTNINTTSNTVTWEGATSFSDGTALDGNVILPVRLLDFAAERIADGAVRIAWRTASEEQNDFFAVERSADGYTFAEIFRRAGAGDSSTPRSYEMVDRNPLEGPAYYRLKQTDYDGTTETFRAVYVAGIGDHVPVVYPNPFSGQTLYVRTDGVDPEGTDIVVRDVTGRVMYTEVRRKDGYLEVHFCSPVSRGLYLLDVPMGRPAGPVKVYRH
jgi:hypothetical protein